MGFAFVLAAHDVSFGIYYLGVGSDMGHVQYLFVLTVGLVLDCLEGIVCIFFLKMQFTVQFLLSSLNHGPQGTTTFASSYTSHPSGQTHYTSNPPLPSLSWCPLGNLQIPKSIPKIHPALNSNTLLDSLDLIRRHLHYRHHDRMFLALRIDCYYPSLLNVLVWESSAGGGEAGGH